MNKKNKVKPIIFYPKFEVDEEVYVLNKHGRLVIGRIRKRRFIDFGEEEISTDDKVSMKALGSPVIDSSIIRIFTTYYIVHVGDGTVRRDDDEIWSTLIEYFSYVKKNIENN